MQTSNSVWPSASARAGVAAAVVAVALVFAPVLGFDFVDWDDDIHVYDNPYLPAAGDGDWTRFWTGPYRGLYVPLTYTVWYALAATGGVSDAFGRLQRPDPFAFHLVVYLLHLLNTVLVFGVLRRCLGGGAVGALPWAALFGAALFALHPLQVESVAWVSALKDTLSGALALSSLWLYLRWSERRETATGFVAATLLFAAGLLAKPSLVVWPVATFALAVGAARRPVTRTARDMCWWLLLALPFAIATVSIQSSTSSPTPETAFWLRPLVALDAVGFYATKFLWPLDLAVNYGRTPAVVVASGALWTAWAIPAALALLLARYGDRTTTAGLIFALIYLAPVSGLLPFLHQVYSTVADRYVYLAMLGVALAVAQTFVRASGALGARPVRAAALAWLVVLALLANGQTSVWRDGEALHLHVLKVNPRAAASHGNLGHRYAVAGDTERARQHYEAALAVDARNARAHNNLGNLYWRTLGRPHLARRHYEAALDSGRDTVTALNNLGAFELELGDLDAAVVYLERARTHSPDSADVLYNLGLASERSGDRTGARALWGQALEFRPNHAGVARTLAEVALDDGDMERARTLLARAERVRPESGRAYALVAEALTGRGRVADSLAYYEQALDRSPPHPALLATVYGERLESLGRHRRAAVAFEQALGLQPDFQRARAGAMRNRARVTESAQTPEQENP